MSRPLNEYTTIIRSGVTPTEPFQLSRERAERLDRDPWALREHRARVWTASRSYIVGAGETGQEDSRG